MRDRILLIDGLGFIYRGVLRFGKNNDDSEVNDKIDYTVVYNYFRNLRAIIEEFEPSRCFLVLEGVPEFRKKLFPDYKKNRIFKSGSQKQKTKEEIFRQADIIVRLTSLLPVTLVRAAEYEADDTIYSLANNLKEEEVIIISSDSDLIQILQSLPNRNIKLFHPSKKIFVKAPEYVYVVWKSIAGDVSDNIPSIASAEKAEHLARTAEDLKEFLSTEERRANFSLNKELIELRLVPEEKLEITPYNVNFDALFSEFRKMNFPSLLKESYKERFIETFTENLL